jgi:steroid 5-alpha reductase family enzyme
MEHLMLLLNAVFVLSTLLMIWIFFWAKKLDNYSIVDAAWGFSFSLVAGMLVVLGEGWMMRKLLMLAVVAIWSVRLGWFLTTRIMKHHPHEDNRYVVLRERYGDSVEKGFFWFFQYQAWSIVLLTVPFVVMSMNRSIGFTMWELLGALIMVFAALFESVADRQKAEFKANPQNRGLNCEVGWWARSRHPNYFFEACYWVGVFVMTASSPGGLFCFYVPMVMLHLLMNVTGLPLSEANGEKVYGDAYRDYQKRVPKFFPRFGN